MLSTKNSLLLNTGKDDFPILVYFPLVSLEAKFPMVTHWNFLLKALRSHWGYPHRGLFCNLHQFPFVMADILFYFIFFNIYSITLVIQNGTQSSGTVLISLFLYIGWALRSLPTQPVLWLWMFLPLQWGSHPVPVHPRFPWASRPLLEVPRLNDLRFALRPAPADHLCCLHDSGQETLAAQRHWGRHHRAVLRPSQKK